MSPLEPNAYLRTKVMTASPAELRLMLFDGAIKFARQGRTGLAENDFEAAYTGVTSCQEIVLELINSLRPEHDPDLCEKLTALYVFMYNRLLEASSQRKAALVDEVIKLLEYERETWVMLMSRLDEQRHAGPQPPAASTPAATAPAAANPAPPAPVPPTRSISIQG